MLLLKLGAGFNSPAANKSMIFVDPPQTGITHGGLYHPGFPISNAWLCNQAFQFHNYTKIFLELPFIFSIFPVCRLKQCLFKALRPVPVPAVIFESNV
jgi:hypothetical protein